MRMSIERVLMVLFAGVTLMAAQPPGSASRMITTDNFSAAWNTGTDTEAITSLAWMGGPNLMRVHNINTCGEESDVEYFGNSWAEPSVGGFELVGSGTVTPAGTVAFSEELLPVGISQVTINSNSAECRESAGSSGFSFRPELVRRRTFLPVARHLRGPMLAQAFGL